MKKGLIILFLFFAGLYAGAQKVDSIRVEQTGDLVKVYYKILNSNPSQIFRVSVLCSINGGLRSVPNSLSGDYGENVVGGRDQYMVLWDVLKDVDELKSAEFFIQAELKKDLSAETSELFDTTKFWADKRFIALTCIDLPGPGLGIRIGYLGSYGISVHAYRGNIPVLDEFESNQYYPGPEPGFGAGIDLTKRIISRKAFQMHLLAGVRNCDALVYFNGPPPAFWTHGVESIELGTIIAYKRVLFSLIYSHYSTERLVNKHDEPVIPAGPDDFVNFGIGIRF
jgi:hypothetical protein